MARGQLSCFCVLLLISSPELQASCPSRDQATNLKLKQAAAVMTEGSVVQIKLCTGQKLRGRLTQVTDLGVELQRFLDQKITTDTLAFENVTSIKLKGKGITLTRDRTAPQSAMEQLTLLPTGSLVQVTRAGGPRMRGRLGALGRVDFQLERLEPGGAVFDRIAYADLRSVELAGKPMTTMTKVVLITGLATLTVIAGIGACLASGACLN